LFAESGRVRQVVPIEFYLNADAVFRSRRIFPSLNAWQESFEDADEMEDKENSAQKRRAKITLAPG
jgi:hypothetical protein